MCSEKVLGDQLCMHAVVVFGPFDADADLIGKLHDSSPVWAVFAGPLGLRFQCVYSEPDTDETCLDNRGEAGIVVPRNYVFIRCDPDIAWTLNHHTDPTVGQPDRNGCGGGRFEDPFPCRANRRTDVDVIAGRSLRAAVPLCRDGLDDPGCRGGRGRGGVERFRLRFSLLNEGGQIVAISVVPDCADTAALCTASAEITLEDRAVRVVAHRVTRPRIRGSPNRCARSLYRSTALHARSTALRPALLRAARQGMW